MKVWIVSGWVHLVIGFALGWVMFNRPKWVTNLLARIRAKIMFWET
jgi:hypothetical protein